MVGRACRGWVCLLAVEVAVEVGGCRGDGRWARGCLREREEGGERGGRGGRGGRGRREGSMSAVATGLDVEVEEREESREESQEESTANPSSEPPEEEEEYSPSSPLS